MIYVGVNTRDTNRTMQHYVYPVSTNVSYEQITENLKQGDVLEITLVGENTNDEHKIIGSYKAFIDNQMYAIDFLTEVDEETLRTLKGVTPWSAINIVVNPENQVWNYRPELDKVGNAEGVYSMYVIDLSPYCTIEKEEKDISDLKDLLNEKIDSSVEDLNNKFESIDISIYPKRDEVYLKPAMDELLSYKLSVATAENRYIKKWEIANFLTDEETTKALQPLLNNYVDKSTFDAWAKTVTGGELGANLSFFLTEEKADSKYATKEVVSNKISSYEFDKYKEAFTKEITDKVAQAKELEFYYTNPKPTPVRVGAIPAGTTFKKVPLQVLLDMLLYPYEEPEFTKFTTTSKLTLKIGEPLKSPIRLYWSTIIQKNIREGSLEFKLFLLDTIINLEPDRELEYSGQANFVFAPIVRNEQTKASIVARAYNTANEIFLSTLDVEWLESFYFQKSNNQDVKENTLFNVKEVSKNSFKDVEVTFEQGEGYLWIYVPTDWNKNVINIEEIKTEAKIDNIILENKGTIYIQNEYGVLRSFYKFRSINIIEDEVTLKLDVGEPTIGNTTLTFDSDITQEEQFIQDTVEHIEIHPETGEIIVKEEVNVEEDVIKKEETSTPSSNPSTPTKPTTQPDPEPVPDKSATVTEYKKPVIKLFNIDNTEYTTDENITELNIEYEIENFEHIDKDTINITIIKED